MELISVIIPVYNVEKYICRCIESITEQSYKKLEIILVNDGSTDKSSQYCEEFSKSDSRIKVIHINNSGVSVARNVGMSEARGDFLCFVDSDDFLPKSAIANLYDGIKNNNADLCCGCWAQITPKTTKYNRHHHEIISTDDKEKMMDIMDFEEIKGPVAKLYKKDIIQKNQMCFMQNIKVNEDTIFVYKYLHECKRICIINQNVYYYNRLSVGSATTCFYDKFNWSSWLCIKEYFNNIIVNKEDWHECRVQKKIVDKYFVINQYIMFYLYDTKEQAVIQLEETYRLFEDLFKIDTIDANPDIFYSFIKIYPYLQAGDFLGLFDYLDDSNVIKNKRIKKSFKNFIIEAIAKIKIFVIFKMHIGYRD